MSGDAGTHRPVMVREVVAALAPGDGTVVIDGTFGGGGYAAALLDAAACRVVGIDRDPEAVRRGQVLVDSSGGRLAVLHGRYGDMVALLGDTGVTAVDGVALDLGFSSDQIEDGERGFSFRIDGPLDMRMDRDGPTAADVVNSLSEAELAKIINHLGEERAARRIARAIVRTRDSPSPGTASRKDLGTETRPLRSILLTCLPTNSPMPTLDNAPLPVPCGWRALPPTIGAATA